MQALINLITSVLFLDIPLKFDDTIILHYNLFTVVVVFFVVNLISLAIYRFAGMDKSD